MTPAEYFHRLQIPYHIGKEHPALEQLALTLLRQSPRKHVLELGYQAGGFAFPLIAALKTTSTFVYCGVDSLAYPNAVPREAMHAYLFETHKIGLPQVCFYRTAVRSFLRDSVVYPFDLVLLDHAKRDYVIDLWWLLHRGWVAPHGTILIHDVLGKAKGLIAWSCRMLAAWYGYSWTVDADVPEGVAVLRRKA